MDLETGTTRRRFLINAGVVVLASAYYPFARPIFAQSSKTPLTIALIADLSGSGQKGGLLSQQSTQLAVDTINQAGGVGGLYSLNLVVEDSKTSATESVNAANRLVNRGDISFVIGPQRTNEILPIQPMFAAAEIPHIMIGSTDRALTDAHASAPLSLRYSPQDIMQMAPLAKHAVSTGHKKFFALGVDNGDGRDPVLAFESLLGPLGATLMASEFYPFGNTDFSTLIAKFKTSGADALLVSDGLPTSVIALINEYVLQGLALDRFYGSIVFSGDTFFNQVAKKGQAEGIIFPWFYDDGTPLRDFAGLPPAIEAIALNAAFQAETGKPAGPFATVQAWAWGSVKLVQQAIEGLISQSGSSSVANLHPVRELPQLTVEQFILNVPAGSETGPKFKLTFGDAIGFYGCGQGDVRCGVGTYRAGQLVLLQDRSWTDELITGICG
jgi:ABC-type branched-subunit amino acid transport system substrate-binding protein